MIYTEAMEIDMNLDIGCSEAWDDADIKFTDSTMEVFAKGFSKGVKFVQQQVRNEYLKKAFQLERTPTKSELELLKEMLQNADSLMEKLHTSDDMIAKIKFLEAPLKKEMSVRLSKNESAMDWF